MQHHQRVVGARLDAQVPIGDGRIHLLLTGNGSERAKFGGHPPGQPEPVVEQTWSESNGDGQRGRPEVHCLTGVDRRLVVLRRAATDRLARGEPRGHRRPAAKHLLQLAGVVGGHVERREHQPLLRGCGDPGLPVAVERYDR